MPSDADVLIPLLFEVLEPVRGPVAAITGLTALTGGASRQTWRFEVTGADHSVERLVLRMDHAGAPASGLRLEADLLDAARRAGVPVPEVVVGGVATSAHGAGASYLIMRFVDGETIPRRILRNDDLAAARRVLGSQCGTVLAAVHRIVPTDVPGLPGGDQLENLRILLDEVGEPHPAFELAWRHLAQNRPPPSPSAVVHGDFRNGNLIVGPEGIRAVIDWELAHVGDPMEDLGWLCIKAWRFGSELPVGGFGSIDALVEAYEAAGRPPVDRHALAWWEMFGTLRWGIIAIVQTMTHISGTLRSVELAAVGRRVCEMEWDLMEMLP